MKPLTTYSFRAERVALTLLAVLVSRSIESGVITGVIGLVLVGVVLALTRIGSERRSGSP